MKFVDFAFIVFILFLQLLLAGQISLQFVNQFRLFLNLPLLIVSLIALIKLSRLRVEGEIRDILGNSLSLLRRLRSHRVLIRRRVASRQRTVIEVRVRERLSRLRGLIWRLLVWAFPRAPVQSRPDGFDEATLRLRNVQCVGVGIEALGLGLGHALLLEE